MSDEPSTATKKIKRLKKTPVFSQDETAGLITLMQESLVHRQFSDYADNLRAHIATLVRDIADAYNTENAPYRDIEAAKQVFITNVNNDNIMIQRKSRVIANEIGEDMADRARGR